jgi:hypothetical protein
MGRLQKIAGTVSSRRMIEVIGQASQSTDPIVSPQDKRGQGTGTHFIVKLRQLSQSIARSIKRHGLHL